MTTVAEIVANDLCVGCGLCEAVSGGRATMVMTPDGSLRPTPVDAFSAAEEARIIAACPGVVAEARSAPHLPLDPVWGHHGTMRLAARYEGMADAGVDPITTHGLRVAELGDRLGPAESAAQRTGAATRMRRARA